MLAYLVKLPAQFSAASHRSRANTCYHASSALQLLYSIAPITNSLTVAVRTGVAYIIGAS